MRNMNLKSHEKNRNVFFIIINLHGFPDSRTFRNHITFLAIIQ